MFFASLFKYKNFLAVLKILFKQIKLFKFIEKFEWQNNFLNCVSLLTNYRNEMFSLTFL